MNCSDRDTNQESDGVVMMPEAPPHEHLIPRGKNCAVYNATAPAGFKFFQYHNKSFKNKSPEQLEEELKTKLIDLKLDTEKSPIAKLNEIMFLKRKTIDYDLVSMTGHVHCPVFTFRLKTDELTVYGSGSSKKEAKKNAAFNFLDKMDFSNGINTITSTTSNVSPTPLMEPNEDHSKKIIETKSEVNPIGLLQEMCMAHHWELPNYEYFRDGLSETHNSWHTVKCYLKNFKTTGEGKTKQSAKRDAALLMYNNFKDSIHEKIITPKYGQYKSPIKAMLNNLQTDEVDTKCLEKLNPSDVLMCIETFMNTLKASNKSGINRLKLLDFIEEFNVSAVDTLDKIGKEEGFEIKYVLVSNECKLGILVQVSITPLLVIVGSGQTVEEAQEKAAYSTLMYLKVLLEK